MLKTFFSSQPLWEKGLTFVRIIIGIMLIRHGIEVFELSKMNEYGKRLNDLQFPAPLFMAYIGKSMEFIGGICILFGFLTRLIIIPLAITFLIISFGMGHGKILMEDQHPFLFVILFLVIFFTGPGKFSLDYVLFDRKKSIVHKKQNGH